MAGGGGRSNNRYNARRAFPFSNRRTESLLRNGPHQAGHGAFYRQPHRQQPEHKASKARARVNSYERSRTIYLTFSVDEDTPLEYYEIKEYLDRILGDDVAIAFHMDLPKQGWVVLADEQFVSEVVGWHYIRNASMVVKPFMAYDR